MLVNKNEFLILHILLVESNYVQICSQHPPDKPGFASLAF